MATDVKIQIKNIFDRIKSVVGEAISPAQSRSLALSAIDIIVKRTKLGYGVKDNYGTKYRLPTLSQRYVKFRRRYTKLSNTTSPSKSNITLTGELLDSIGIKKAGVGNVTISAIGSHVGGLTNEKLIGYLQQQGRYFMRVSELEFNQLVRIYRKTFGDLLQKKKLLS